MCENPKRADDKFCTKCAPKAQAQKSKKEQKSKQARPKSTAKGTPAGFGFTSGGDGNA